MRASYLAVVPLLVALGAMPAQAQVSARLHVDLPISRRLPAVYAVRDRPLLVRNYDPYRYGAWETSFDRWAPETVYLYDGYYYDYPVVAYAQPIVVYGYRNELFFAPRERAFGQWREPRVYPAIGRAYQSIPRDVRQYGTALRYGRSVRSAPPMRSSDRSRPRARQH